MVVVLTSRISLIRRQLGVFSGLHKILQDTKTGLPTRTLAKLADRISLILGQLVIFGGLQVRARRSFSSQSCRRCGRISELDPSKAESQS
jgi:hypothetical protein